jgi:hypothetical protein
MEADAALLLAMSQGGGQSSAARPSDMADSSQPSRTSSIGSGTMRRVLDGHFPQKRFTSSDAADGADNLQRGDEVATVSKRVSLTT